MVLLGNGNFPNWAVATLLIVSYLGSPVRAAYKIDTVGEKDFLPYPQPRFNQCRC